MDLGCLNFCSLRLLTTVKFRVYVERQTLIKSVSNRGERCSLWHGRASEVNTPYVGNKKKPDPTAFLECICQANTLENSPKEPLYKAPDFTAAPGECFDAAARPPGGGRQVGLTSGRGQGKKLRPGAQVVGAPAHLCCEHRAAQGRMWVLKLNSRSGSAAPKRRRSRTTGRTATSLPSRSRSPRLPRAGRP